MTDASAIGRDRLGVEAASPIAHEDRRLLRFHFQVDRHDRGAGVAGGVEDGLACGGPQGLGAFDAAVAHAHDLDRHALLGLDRRCELFQRRAQ